MHILHLLFLSNLFSTDMIIIVFIALLLFGGEKLPEIARGLGKGIRDFKDASEGVKREINNQINTFDEKRDEDKRIEEAITSSQEAAKGHNPVENLDPIVESRQPENTIPVSDNIFIEDKHAPTEGNTENHTNQETGQHVTSYTSDNKNSNNINVT
jgi:sec-independent protein translocase protein TatA